MNKKSELLLEYLKDSYKTQLYGFLFLNLAVFWVLIIAKSDFANFTVIIDSFSTKDGLMVVLAPIGVLGLNGLLSPEMKAAIVFWRFSDPLPGSRAFSEYLLKDERVDPDALKAAWGEFPTVAKEQNRLWYRIYKTTEDDLIVREAHRAFLHARDLCGFSLLFAIAFGSATAFSDSPRTVILLYIGSLVVQYLTFSVAARHYGVRFVTNVLTTASYRKS